MSLIDPTNPTLNRSLSDPQILRAMAQLDQRINYLGQNLVQLGFHVEYLLNKLIQANADYFQEHGKNLMVIDLDGEFQEFAAAKQEVINQELEAIRDQLATKRGINLDDKLTR